MGNVQEEFEDLWRILGDTIVCQTGETYYAGDYFKRRRGALCEGQQSPVFHELFYRVLAGRMRLYHNRPGVECDTGVGGAIHVDNPPFPGTSALALPTNMARLGVLFTRLVIKPWSRNGPPR